MADELKRAMEALEAVVKPCERKVAAVRTGLVRGALVADAEIVVADHGAAILAALRERDAAVEQARKNEREACAAWHDERAAHFARFGDEDASRRHKRYAAAIRARGAR